MEIFISQIRVHSKGRFIIMFSIAIVEIRVSARSRDGAHLE